MRRQDYQEYVFLDWNYNGIACDNGDKDSSNTYAVGWWPLTFGGLPVGIMTSCEFSNYRVEYGTKIGFASLTMMSSCSVKFSNTDSTYSLLLPGGEIIWHAAFNFDLGKELEETGDGSEMVERPRSHAVIMGANNRSPIADLLKPGKSLSYYSNQSLERLDGERSLIEAALLRLKSGLQPTLYLSIPAPRSETKSMFRWICLGPKSTVIFDEYGEIGPKRNGGATGQYNTGGCDQLLAISGYVEYYPWDEQFITITG